jgi:hypothetical protein
MAKKEAVIDSQSAVCLQQGYFGLMPVAKCTFAEARLAVG